MKVNSIIKYIFYIILCLTTTPIFADKINDIIIINNTNSNNTTHNSNTMILNKVDNKKQADDLLMNAMAMLGVNYKWGGNNPHSGMDCSGFIQYIFKTSQDVNLPRTARMMSQQGMLIARNNLQPGDLIFFATGKRNRAVTHVGVYIGDDKFIHTPRTGKAVEIRSLSNKYWTKAYLWARRIDKQ
ncbi:MAG: peptidase C40 NLP/P60 [Neisseriaceae bacterium]|nr:MAG: peptidase C40 NLP/P60 [Neisseriaceae bacterium]